MRNLQRRFKSTEKIKSVEGLCMRFLRRQFGSVTEKGMKKAI